MFGDARGQLLEVDHTPHLGAIYLIWMPFKIFFQLQFLNCMLKFDIDAQWMTGPPQRRPLPYLVRHSTW